MKIKQNGLFTNRVLSDKERRNLDIFEVIRKKGITSRTEISRITGINIVSVSNYIKNYIDKRLILEKGLDVSTGGRKPELVELNAAGNSIIGVDCVKNQAVLSNLAMGVIDRVSLTPDHISPDATSRAIALIDELMKKSNAGLERIKMIGIGADDTAAISVDAIAKQFRAPAFVEGNAACAAFAEKRLNPQADVDDLLYMYSDEACGVVIKGELCFGAVASSGPIELPEDGISGKEADAILEESKYLKPWNKNFGIAQAVRNEVARGVGTKAVELAGGVMDKIVGDVVIEAARQNDEVALDVIQRVGISIGLRTAYLVNLFNPSVVVVGGGIEKAGELMLNPIKRVVGKLALSRSSSRVNIISSVLKDDAISLGAVSLAVREIFLKI